jgi:hypothetical protein
MCAQPPIRLQMQAPPKVNLSRKPPFGYNTLFFQIGTRSTDPLPGEGNLYQQEKQSTGPTTHM